MEPTIVNKRKVELTNVNANDIANRQKVPSMLLSTLFCGNSQERLQHGGSGDRRKTCPLPTGGGKRFALLREDV